MARPALAGSTKARSVTIIVELLVNIVLPYAIYYAADARFGDVKALLASSLPPILWSLGQFAAKRRIDALSVLVVAGIVLSLLAFIGGGSARFLQLRENLVTGVIALVFLGSAAIGKPLIYQLARAGAIRKNVGAAQELEQLRDNAHFRRGMTIMTLVWGFGLLAQTALACAMVYAVSIGTYLLISPILGYGTMGALALWTFAYVRLMKRRGAARRAAADGAGLIGDTKAG
jgi:hypothetical protein